MLSAIGRDRPGIVAAIARVLLVHDVNIEDSQMTILRGRFAMTLVLGAPEELAVATLRAGLADAGAELGLDALTLTEVDDDAQDAAVAVPTHIVSVYGADHPGIVNAVASALATQGANVTDLQTRLVSEGELYSMLLEVSLPKGLEPAQLVSSLEPIGSEQGVQVTVRELDRDIL